MKAQKDNFKTHKIVLDIMIMMNQGLLGPLLHHFQNVPLPLPFGVYICPALFQHCNSVIIFTTFICICFHHVLSSAYLLLYVRQPTTEN